MLFLLFCSSVFCSDGTAPHTPPQQILQPASSFGSLPVQRVSPPRTPPKVTAAMLAQFSIEEIEAMARQAAYFQEMMAAAMKKAVTPEKRPPALESAACSS